MFSLTSALAVSALFFSSISAQSLDLSKVTIQRVTYGGSGCTQGSKVSFKQSSDSRYIHPNWTQLGFQIGWPNLSFVATFPNITASIGPTVNVENNRKNCQINVEIGYPAGLQYAPVSTRYTGETILDKGVKGVLSTVFYFSGGKFSQLLTELSHPPSNLPPTKDRIGWP